MSEDRSQKDINIFLGVVTVLAIAIFVGIFFVLRQPHSHSDGGPAVADPDIHRELQPFVLTERSGTEISRDALSNRFLVVNFIHTGCSVSCEQVNKRMAEVQKLVAGDPDVQLLSLTIDPRSDTPPALLKFADRFGADAKKWLFLTGDKDSIYDLIESSFLRRDPNDSKAMATGGFVDVDRIALVDKDGRVRRYFNGLQASAPTNIVHAIEQLRRESAL